jgi:type IV pilus assembly protein PilV
MSIQKKKLNAQSGFSMIEVLVTITIIAIALLGSAGLQAYALKTNQGGQFRNQAAFFVSDIAERMEANKVYATALTGYASGGALAAGAVDCTTALCTPTQLAEYDVRTWEEAIALALPGGTGTVTQTTAGSPSTYNIVVSWVDRKTDVTYAATAGATETFSITTSRTIRN